MRNLDRDGVDEGVPAVGWMRQQHGRFLVLGQRDALQSALSDQTIEAFSNRVHLLSFIERKCLKLLVRIDAFCI